MGAALKVLQIVASVDPRGGGLIESILQQARFRPQDDVEIASLDSPRDP